MISLRDIFLIAIAVSVTAGCRSGHFETKAFNQSGQGFQVVAIASSQLGTCSTGVEDCRSVQVELNILGPNREPLRDQAFEFTAEHSDFVSLTPARSNTDSLGRVKVQISFKVHSNEGPSILRTLFVVRSDQFGVHGFIASFNPRRDADPLTQFEELQENFKPDTVIVSEQLVVAPQSLVTVKTHEISPQLIEFQMEHSAIIGSLTESRIRNRKIHYEISYPGVERPSLKGNLFTNVNGEAHFRFPVKFFPYENEKIDEIKFSIGLGDKPVNEDVSWYATLSFERDSLKPLLGFSPTPREKDETQIAPQKMQIESDFEFLVNPEELSFDLKSDLSLRFLPKIEVKGALSITRKAIGSGGSISKKLASSRACGKLFAVRESPKFEILSETPIVWPIDSNGEIHAEVLPALTTPFIDNLVWIMALELPGFDRIPKAVFRYYPSTRALAPWSMVEASERLNSRILDLSCSQTTTTNPSGRKSVLEDLLPKYSTFDGTAPGFDEYVARITRTTESEPWRDLLNRVTGKNPQNTRIVVKQIDLVREIRSWQALESKTGGGVEADENTPSSKAVKEAGFSFRIEGKSLRCFAFFQGEDPEPIVYCLRDPAEFAEIVSWKYRSAAGERRNSRQVSVVGPKAGILVKSLYPFQ